MVLEGLGPSRGATWGAFGINHLVTLNLVVLGASSLDPAERSSSPRF